MNIYKKISVIVFFLFFLLNSNIFAQSNSVWFYPLDAKIGDDIVLNTFVLNNTVQDATITVLFSNLGKEIGSQTLVVKKGTGSIFSTNMKMPMEKIAVDISVKSATYEDVKNIKSLEGKIGSLDVGGVEKFDIEKLPIINKVTSSKQFSFLEKFRIDKSQYYTSIRDKNRNDVQSVEIKEVVSLLTPENSNPETPTKEEEKKPNRTKSFFNFIFASVMVSFFSKPIIFYGLSVLLVFFAIRFFLRLF